MDLNEARRTTEALITKHLDDSWRFEWIGHKTVMGQCSHRDHTIMLSKPLTQISPEDAIVDTALHEIAHALAGPSHNHDATWRRFCVQIGAPTDAQINPERVGNPRQTLAPWVGTCPAGHVSPTRYFRKPRSRYACSLCCKGKWSEEHILTYRKMF